MKKILIGILGVMILAGGMAPGDGEAQAFTISGLVTDLGGKGIPGVTMNGLPENPITAVDGSYSATVPAGWSGVVKPQKIGYAIFPFSTQYDGINSDQPQNYTTVLLPKVALSMPPATYNLGDPINITMTLQNQSSDLFALQGFMDTNFALFLQFTDPDNKLITSNYGVGRTPPPPASVPVITQEDKVELLAVDYVENVPADWVVSMTFNIFDNNYYTLSKGGNYSVKAKISVRAYLPNDVSQTNPQYAPHDFGSSGYAESNIVTFALSTQGGQTITVTQEPPTSAMDTSSFPVAATASSGLPVSIGASGACSGTGSNSADITMTSGTGTCLITFDQAGDTAYSPAAQVARWVTAQTPKKNQAITFTPLSNKTYGDAPFTVSATATSNLPVNFTTSGNCTSSGTTITITGAGSCTVTAHQGGNTEYNPAPDVSRNFSVAKADQTITWSNPAEIFYGTALSAAQLNATVSGRGPSSAGPLTYNPAAGTVLNAGAGQTLSVTATQTPNYNKATKSVSINVLKADQAITVTTHAPASAVYSTSFPVAATGGGSANPVAIVGSGACSGSGNNSASIPITSGSGTCTVTYNQAGNNNYSAAPQVSDSTTAAPATATVTLSNLTQTYTGSPLTPTATTNPTGLAILWTGAPKTNAGSYPVTATINDTNYQGSASGTFVINPAVTQYVFTGFFSPVDNPPTVNSAKAGQAVPVKWRLTDASGVGISDPGSFAGLTSFQANCKEWSGITDPIPEEASGASGLQYLGDGNWQYNWKTSKGYAGTCRVMVLTLKDGTQHKAEFKFK